MRKQSPDLVPIDRRVNVEEPAHGPSGGQEVGSMSIGLPDLCGAKTRLLQHIGSGEGVEPVAYESTAEPIKLGYLFDFKLPDGFPEEAREDLTLPFELVFRQGLDAGMIDRPVEIVYREVEGLPKGTIKSVIDAYGELVEQGCLVVFGPYITDNCVPTREAIEDRFRVPAISCTGTDDWLGEWTFALPQGSMTDEPIFWSDLLVKAGQREVGVLIEQSLVGESYIQNFRRPAARGESGSSQRNGFPRPLRTSAQRSRGCMRRRHKPWCIADSDSGSRWQITHCRSWIGIRRATWVLHSRTHG